MLSMFYFLVQFPKNPDLYKNPGFNFSVEFLNNILFSFFQIREYLSTTYIAKMFLPRVIGILSVSMIFFFPAFLIVSKNIINLFINKRKKLSPEEPTVLLSFIYSFIFHVLLF